MRMQAGVLALAMAVFGAPAAAQFDSSEQVKPILKMIKPQWISLREYDGNDLIYFTMLEVYRCGIEQIRYIINDGKPKVWETEPCDGDEVFSKIGEDRLPYAVLPYQSIERLRIELTYDDGTIEWAEYSRDDAMQ